MHQINQGVNRALSISIAEGSLGISGDGHSSRRPKRKGTSNTEFIFQIFISIEGPALFIMPAIFKEVGYLLGILGSLGVSLFYAYTLHIYLWCDEYVSKKKHVEEQSLYQLIQDVFDDIKCPRTGYYLKKYLKYEIILSSTLGLSFGLLYATRNIQIILDYFNYKATDQFILLCLLVPSILMCWLPNVRALSILAFLVTFFLLIIIIQVLYYILINPVIEPRVVAVNKVSSFPNFLFSFFFILTLTPLLFPLRNEMKYPRTLNKTFGGLNLSILLVTILNMFFSLEAYFRLGDNIRENILSNIPQNEAVILTNCLYTMTLIGSGGMLFFVIFNIVWVDDLKPYLGNSNKYLGFFEYLTRTLIAIFVVLIAMVIPTFSLFVNLISSFSYPYDCILLPLILESVIVWHEHPPSTMTFLIVIKNIVICLLCILACIFAFYESLVEIVSFYDPSLLKSMIK